MNNPLSNPETAVPIKKDKFDKFDWFITLPTFYHVKRCKNGNNCLKCDFIIT